ncbi:hypothetical protein [Bacteroides acidifaciens]|uniref:hypothetical protein n=1 Tax=Bacteroides acidifaciens TaxID=85831 RepID=UPI000EA2987D
MTKMSQCSKCIGDGVHCEHYRPIDDSPCPNYIFAASSTEQDIYEVKKALQYIAVIVVALILLSFIGAVTFWDYISIILYLSFLVSLYLVIAHFECFDKIKSFIKSFDKKNKRVEIIEIQQCDEQAEINKIMFDLFTYTHHSIVLYYGGSEKDFYNWFNSYPFPINDLEAMKELRLNWGRLVRDFEEKLGM